MLLSELIAALDNYDSAKWSPSRMEVHMGCDCGCGGDVYTVDSWNLEEEEAERAIKETKKICTTIGITYDGVD